MPHTPNDLETGMNFFHFFSMFEYALKANGYTHPKTGIVKQADWEGFVKDNQELLDVGLDQNQNIRDSVNYLLSSPPKQQSRNEEGVLEWVDPVVDDNAPDRTKLVKHIRQVRNNLFHGGKFRGDYFSAPERSSDLIAHCTAIMHHLTTNHEGMQEAFEGASYDPMRYE